MEELFKHSLMKINSFLNGYFESLNSDMAQFEPIKNLLRSINYSLFSGGKRFRPLLTLLTARTLNKDESLVLPFAASIEMIHTYSLIHDDLPCMDDDDVRRGAPTNHKIFGEDIALLSGDALLTESFFLLANSYSPTLAIKLIKSLSSMSGLRGMVGGQAMDLKILKSDLNLNILSEIHRLKTGALIEASIVGASDICGATDLQSRALIDFSRDLGLAFQVSDDILDSQDMTEQINYVTLLGLDSAKQELERLTQNCLRSLDIFSVNAKDLRILAEFNFSRCQT